jgi:two-component system, LuxR family, sensor kinase FixL
MVDTTTAETTASGVDTLVQRLESDHATLVNVYRQTLREHVFTNRAEMRPVMLDKIASEEVDDLLDYLGHPAHEKALQRGTVLCDLGLSEQSVLGLGEASRQFFLTQLHNEAIAPALEAIDDYHHTVIRGFMAAREKVILNEQERIRGALQRTLGRYSLQMDVAGSLAGVTTSILDLDDLVRTAVELIRERFGLYYVGLFLTDSDNRWAILRAGTGEVGKELLLRGHLFEVNSNSIIGMCVESGEARVVMDMSKEDAKFLDPLLSNALSEVAIPLRTRGKVIGAITAQSLQAAAFSDLDVTALRILADQLANAIENARLFAEQRRSEEKYRTLLDNIEEGYYELDMDGKYIFVNDALVYLINLPKNKILGRHFQDFIDPEYVDRITQAYKAAYQLGGAVHGIEYKVRSKQGLGRYVETSALLSRNIMGEMAGLRGIVRDITTRKQAEQYQIERKVLERSNKELEQFASVASHDLQEPLRKIQTLGDRLKTKSGALLDQEGRDYLDRMIVAANRAQTLIHDVLSLSRVATQGQPFVRVDLNKVARSVVSDLEARIKETGGRVEIDNLPTIEADQSQMAQLLQNLIVNGLKFHRPDQKPRVKVSGRTIENERLPEMPGQPSSRVQILVKDNGIGFDEKYLDRIFQPFQRLHSQEEYAGTGIGLSICRRIVERHSGEISAKSRLEHGAMFIVTLPVKQMKGGDFR